jgi:hypothetical protein
LIGREVNPTLLVEDDALFLEQVTLQPALDPPFGRADAALRVQHAVPRDVWIAGRPHSPAHGARCMGLSEQPGDLPIGGDATWRYLPHDLVDTLEE